MGCHVFRSMAAERIRCAKEKVALLFLEQPLPDLVVEC
jgi:hypothetical protein